jgi:hypothetical protein
MCGNEASRELFAASPKNRACLDEQGISKIWPAIGRRPERSAWTSADIERGLRREIRAGLFDRGEARAHRRIGRGQPDGEVGKGVFIARDMKPAVAPLFAVTL